MEHLDLVDVIREALRGERDDLHTAMPGKVVKYYPDKQTADIKLQVQLPMFDDENNRVDPLEFPMLPQVPVIFPRASGFVITFPLSEGDFVWVMIAEGGMGEYRLTGQESEPFDVSRHQISSCTCMPGMAPDPSALTDPDITGNNLAVIGYEGQAPKVTFQRGDGATVPDEITIGQGETQIKATEAVGVNAAILLLCKLATDFVALSSKVDTNLEALRATMDAHQHISAAPGSNTAPIPFGGSTQHMAAMPSTAAAKVKAL